VVGSKTAEDIQQLKQMLAVETSGQRLILDLRDVTLDNQRISTIKVA
jgi:hypothetical protein